MLVSADKIIDNVSADKLKWCVTIEGNIRGNGYILFYIHTHTHTHLMAFCPGLPGWACTRKVKPIWISLKQETVSGSGISWAICKSALCSRQIATPAPHHSVFHRPDALPATQPTASKHWRHIYHITHRQTRKPLGHLRQ